MQVPSGTPVNQRIASAIFVSDLFEQAFLIESKSTGVLDLRILHSA